MVLWGLARLAGSERGMGQLSIAGPREVEGAWEGAVGRWERKRGSQASWRRRGTRPRRKRGGLV